MQVASLARPVPLHGAGSLAVRRPSRIIILDGSESSEEEQSPRALRGGSAIVDEDEVEDVMKPLAPLEYSRTVGSDNRVDEVNGIGIDLLNNLSLPASAAFPAGPPLLGVRVEHNMDTWTERQTCAKARGLEHIGAPALLDRTNVNSREGRVPEELRPQADLALGRRQDDCSSYRPFAPKRRKCPAVRDYPFGCGKNLSILHPNGDMITRRKSYVSEVSVTKESSEAVGDHPAKKSKSGRTDLNKVCGADQVRDNPVSSVLESNVLSLDLVKHVSKINVGNPDVKKRRRSDWEGKDGGNSITLAGSQLQQGDGFVKSQHHGQFGDGQEYMPSRKTISSLGEHPRNHMALAKKKSKALSTGAAYDLEQLVARPLSSDFKDRLPIVKEASAMETKSEVSSRALVKQTLYDFESIRRTLLKEHCCKRPDLESMRILKYKGRWRNCEEKIIGEVPGVEVGDQFAFRAEMLVIGLHRQVQAGIDFIPGSKRSSGRPIATSIVASGVYEDDDDCGDTFIYTGQGGNNYSGDMRQQRDQTLVRGNLAMVNSHEEKIPVRVIRGSPDASSPSDKMYTYDGLYNIVKCWLKRGLSGFSVYQFELTRQLGQPELGSSIVNFVGKLKKKGLIRPYLLSEDLSQGRERLPISLVNEVDDESQPAFFIYIRDLKYPQWYSPELPKGCNCVGECVDENKCYCAAKNGGGFPYNEAGYILRDKSVVFECGSSCRCSSSCYNRVSQRGIRYQLEVFKTKNRGWGVRSLNSIRPGGFICEYTGELLSDAEAESRTGSDEYLFDIGNKSNSWGDVSELMDVSASMAVVPVVEDVGYTIDAKQYGNVARFINHSCSPNLFAQNVIFDSDDLRTPHVMLFAMENIPPMRELTYDYNYSIGHVRDANGNVKTKSCFCGAADCQGRLY